MELRDADSGGTRTIRVGDQVVIRLAENPTTGYAWELSQSGAGALRVVESRFEPGASAAGLVGGGGQRLLRLAGERPGEVRLDLSERRPWESEADAQQRRQFTIQVQR